MEDFFIHRCKTKSTVYCCDSRLFVCFSFQPGFKSTYSFALWNCFKSKRTIPGLFTSTADVGVPRRLPSRHGGGPTDGTGRFRRALGRKFQNLTQAGLKSSSTAEVGLRSGGEASGCWSGRDFGAIGRRALWIWEGVFRCIQ